MLVSNHYSLFGGGRYIGSAVKTLFYRQLFAVYANTFLPPDSVERFV